MKLSVMMSIVSISIVMNFSVIVMRVMRNFMMIISMNSVIWKLNMNNVLTSMWLLQFVLVTSDVGVVSSKVHEIWVIRVHSNWL